MKFAEQHALAATVLLLGASLAAVMLPSEGEIALLHMKDGQLERARRTYEQRFAGGDVSVAVVRPLHDLYLSFGDLPNATRLMEQFTRANPADTGALRMLAKLYRSGQKLDPYVETLERIVEREPSESAVRELSAVYSFRGNHERQIAMLRQLVAHFRHDSEDLLDLANLQASLKHQAEAVATLERLEREYPAAIDRDTMEFWVNLLIDAGRPGDAYQRALVWLGVHPDSGAAASFAALLRGDRPALAVRLLEPFENAADDHPQLLQEIVHAQLASGQAELALGRLAALFAAGRLPESLRQLLIEAALTQNNGSLAIQVAQAGQARTLSPAVRRDLAIAAADVGSPAVARWARELVADLLPQEIMLSVRLAAAERDSAELDRSLTRARLATGLSIEDRLELVELLSTRSRPTEALDLLVALSSSGETPMWALSNLASMFVTVGRAEQGIEVLDRLRRARPSRHIEQSYAMLTLAAGRPELTVQWAKEQSDGQADAALLIDIFHVANDRSRPSAALYAAERLFEQDSSAEARLRLARAQIGAGQIDAAIAHLQRLPIEQPEVEEVYLLAFAVVQRPGVAPRELQALLAARLANPGLPESRRSEALWLAINMRLYDLAWPELSRRAAEGGEDWLYQYGVAATALGRKPEFLKLLARQIEAGSLDWPARERRLHLYMAQAGQIAALPLLEQFAARRGGTWVAAYEDALRRAGRIEALVERWTKHAGDPAIAAATRREVAFKLLEAGAKPAALHSFALLAQSEPPDGQNVAQLLYLWGPKPPPAALDWLEQRAAQGTGAEQVEWLKRIVEARAPDRAERIIDRLGTGARSMALADLHYELLSRRGDRQGLTAAVTRELAGASGERLRQLAKWASGEGHEPLALAAYRRVLAMQPDDFDANRALGRQAFLESKLSEAERHLSKAAAHGRDYEVHLLLGETLQARNDRSARRHFEASLALLRTAGERTTVMLIAEAQILHRLGQAEAALALMARLTRERPGDRKIQAEYASLLLDSRKYAEAERVLGKP